PLPNSSFPLAPLARSLGTSRERPDCTDWRGLILVDVVTHRAGMSPPARGTARLEGERKQDTVEQKSSISPLQNTICICCCICMKSVEQQKRTQFG
ncbi:hypothetical protein AAFF_G00381500, partial [Aldrovandia affinis]